jgi:hypothetical protein
MELPSVFTLKVSQTQAVLRFYDLDVCNTQCIVYFVFSNLKSTYFILGCCGQIAQPAG